MRTAGRVLERAAAAFLLFGIHAYRAILSPLMGGLCRFMPSCSRYAEAAIRAHGPWRGAWLAARRLLRCRPFGGRGYDPVPEPPARLGEPGRRVPTPATPATPATAAATPAAPRRPSRRP